MAEKLTTAEKETEEARLENYKEIQRAIKDGDQPKPPVVPVVPDPEPPVDPTTLDDAELQAEIEKVSHKMRGLKGVHKEGFDKLATQLQKLCEERDARAAEVLAEKLRAEAAKKPKSAAEKATFAAKVKDAEKAEAEAKFARAVAEGAKK